MLGFGPPNSFPLGENFRGGGITGALTATLDAVTLSTTGALELKGTASITLDAVALSAASTIALKAATAVTLGDLTLASTGVLSLTGALAKTLDDATLAATGAIAIKAALTVTLDDLIYTIHGGPELSIVDTEVLQLPVDCVLAGQQPYRERGREWEIRPRNLTEKTWGRHSSVRALQGGKPSFTVTTGKRGYD